MSDLGDNMITIAESAVRLGISERSLRRVLKRPEYSAQVRQVTRQTNTGTRQAACLPADFLPVLSQHFEKWENTGNSGTSNAAGTAANTGNASEETGASLALVRLTNERLLAEKDSRIAELTAALEHERGQNVRLIEALHREQSLRAIAAPEQTEETTPTQDSDTRAREAAWWQFWKRKD